jgi:hypothetical protein
MRPFDFMVPFWGERYRDFFVDLSLPSLLAPNNLPLLRAEEDHRLLIATTPEDWRAIVHLPIMDRVRRHATPVWIEVSAPITDAEKGSAAHYAATIHHLHHCLKKLFQASSVRRGYGSLLLPDVIFSDFTVASLLNRARQGCELVLFPSLRETAEEVLDDLRRQGYLPAGARLSLTADAQRAMADLVTRHLHPEMLPYDQARSVPLSVMPFLYWRVRGDRGLIMHTFVMMPALLDFAAVPEGHAEHLDRGDIEKDYVGENFARCDRIHVVQDSDEFTTMSLASRSSNWAPSRAESQPTFAWTSKLRRLSSIRESMRFYVDASRDTVSRDLFRLPVRWHRDELDEVWFEDEHRIDRMIDRAVGDYYRAAEVSRTNFPSRRTVFDYAAIADALLRRLFTAVGSLQRQLLELRRRLWLAAVRGDPAAKRWFMWRLQVFWRRLRGYTTHPPRPDVP